MLMCLISAAGVGISFTVLWLEIRSSSGLIRGIFLSPGLLLLLINSFFCWMLLGMLAISLEPDVSEADRRFFILGPLNFVRSLGRGRS